MFFRPVGKFPSAFHEGNLGLGQSQSAAAVRGADAAPFEGLRERKLRQCKIVILDAAAQMFRTIGFQLTTMAMIAEQANISTKTVFNHFQSKHMLLSCLLERVSAENDYLGSEQPEPKYFDERDALPSRIADGLESTSGLGKGIKVIEANRWLFEIAAEQLDLYSVRDARLQTDPYRILIALRAGRIRKVQNAGGMTRIFDAEAIVEMFEIIRHAIYRGWLLSPHEDVAILHQRMRTAAMLFIRGLKPDYP